MLDPLDYAENIHRRPGRYYRFKNRERLVGRIDFELVEINPLNRKDDRARRDCLLSADVAILCLPDDAARRAAEIVSGFSTRLIDASTAHRVAPGWTYGLPT